MRHANHKTYSVTVNQCLVCDRSYNTWHAVPGAKTPEHIFARCNFVSWTCLMRSKMVSSLPPFTPASLPIHCLFLTVKHVTIHPLRGCSLLTVHLLRQVSLLSATYDALFYHLGCGQMGSTLMGPLQQYWCLTDWWKKGRPGWHFWEDKSRLAGVPKKSLCQNT